MVYMVHMASLVCSCLVVSAPQVSKLVPNMMTAVPLKGHATGFTVAGWGAAVALAADVSTCTQPKVQPTT